jgi:acetylornithine deacetylase/succinyl-diaminopimelate desuccinylase-like protein
MRLLERLDRIYEIGGGVGANRPAYTPAEDEAHEVFEQWLHEAGLDVTRDVNGNTFGRLPGLDPGAGEVWTGSHLDSVPMGGRLDGPLGVLAGLEAVERLGRCERSLVVVAFRGEEVGCLGSRALVAGPEPLPSAYVEVHVEQGPVLAGLGAPLGVVTNIVGYVRGERVLEGRAGHAGTTPMDARDDALVTAAHEILRLREIALGIDDAVVTVGQIDVEPGGVNVIPARARLSVDARAPDRERLDALVAAIGIEPSYLVEPAAMHEVPRRAVRDEIAALGLPVVDLPSGAGHDAGVIATAGVPSAMLFVRSLNDGVSHSPDEHSSPEDVAVAVDVLMGALGRLAGL